MMLALDNHLSSVFSIQHANESSRCVLKSIDHSLFDFDLAILDPLGNGNNTLIPTSSPSVDQKSFHSQLLKREISKIKLSLPNEEPASYFCDQGTLDDRSHSHLLVIIG